MTNILIPKYQDILIEQPTIGAEGFYSFKKYKADTHQLVQTLDSCPNLITNAGLAMCRQGFAPWMFVGTGSTPPAFTDTTLQNYLNRSNTVQSVWQRNLLGGAPDYFIQAAGTWRFTPGMATGNLTEVGWGRLISDPPLQYELFSRALIVDSSGNPVTLTVLADEYLDVTYTFRVYAPADPTTVTVNISGVDYQFTCGRYRYNDSFTDTSPQAEATYFSNITTAYTGASLAFAGNITSPTAFTGSAGNDSATVTYSMTYPTLTSANCKIDTGLNRWNFTDGVKGFQFGTIGILAHFHRFLINPAIPKTNTKILTLNIGWSWDRYTP